MKSKNRKTTSTTCYLSTVSDMVKLARRFDESALDLVGTGRHGDTTNTNTGATRAGGTPDDGGDVARPVDAVVPYGLGFALSAWSVCVGSWYLSQKKYLLS